MKTIDEIIHIEHKALSHLLKRLLVLSLIRK